MSLEDRVERLEEELGIGYGDRDYDIEFCYGNSHYGLVGEEDGQLVVGYKDGRRLGGRCINWLVKRDCDWGDAE